MPEVQLAFSPATRSLCLPAQNHLPKVTVSMRNTDYEPTGGTSGCIIAGRLAEADPDLSILVIEGGANNRGVASIVHPVFFLQNIVPTSTTAIFYKGNKAKQLANREPIVPCGGTLGGGSSINFMMYTRAQRSDFDSWKMPGWSADEMWPFLKKACCARSRL